jgi:hypothetical protein
MKPRLQILLFCWCWEVSLPTEHRGPAQTTKAFHGRAPTAPSKSRTVEDHGRMLRKYKWNMQDIWDTMKRPNLQMMGVEEGEKIQAKGIDNLLNRIIAENFPNLKRESPSCRKLTEHQAIRTKRETPPDTSQSKHSAHRTKKEF